MRWTKWNDVIRDSKRIELVKGDRINYPFHWRADTSPSSNAFIFLEQSEKLLELNFTKLAIKIIEFYL